MKETLKDWAKRLYGTYTEKQIQDMDIEKLLERIKNNQISYNDIFVISVSIGIMQDIYSNKVFIE